MYKILIIQRESSGDSVPSGLLEVLPTTVFQLFATPFSKYKQVDLTQFDLVVLYLYTSSGDVAKNCCLDVLSQGVPVVLGLMDDVVSDTTSICRALGITSDIEREVDKGGENIAIRDNLTLLKSNKLEDGDILELRTVDSYMDYLDEGKIIDKNFIKLGHAPTDNSKIVFGLLPKGTSNNVISNLGANFYILGILYSPTGSFFNNIFASVVEDIIVGNTRHPYEIKGHISASDSTPLQREIIAFDRISKKLVSSTLSKSDGNFSLGLKRNNDVFVVCLSDQDSKNSKIYDLVSPVSTN